jgi:hypothetical protein
MTKFHLNLVQLKIEATGKSYACLIKMKLMAGQVNGMPEKKNPQSGFLGMKLEVLV